MWHAALAVLLSASPAAVGCEACREPGERTAPADPSAPAETEAEADYDPCDSFLTEHARIARTTTEFSQRIEAVRDAARALGDHRMECLRRLAAGVAGPMGEAAAEPHAQPGGMEHGGHVAPSGPEHAGAASGHDEGHMAAGGSDPAGMHEGHAAVAAVEHAEHTAAASPELAGAPAPGHAAGHPGDGDEHAGHGGASVPRELPIVLAQVAAPPDVVEWLDDESPQVRKIALAALARMGSESTLAAVIRVAARDTPEVRVFAIQTFSRYRPHAARFTAVLRNALSDPDPAVRTAALRAAQLLGLRTLGPAVLSALGDPDDEVREAAIFAVRNLGVSEAVDPLFELLEDRSARIRRYSVHALGVLGDRRVVRRLRAARADAPPELAQEIDQALARLESEPSATDSPAP